MNMPQGLLAGFARRIGPLMAEEALHQINVLQIGTGAMKKARAQQMLARWKRLASRADGTRRSAPPMSLARMGIRLVHAEKNT
jgi:hypothetical protein